MYGVVLPEDILDLRLVVIAIANDLDIDSLTPVWDQLQGLLADLLDLGEVEVVLGDNETEIYEIAETLRDPGLIHAAHSDPHLGLIEHEQVFFYLCQLGQEKSWVAQI